MTRTLAFPLLFAALAPTLASADTLALSDPTRPPSAYAGEAALEGAVEGAGPASRLTFVILPKSGRPMAMIGGQMVTLGGRVGDARLIRLSETEAVLKGAGGTERLLLTPDAEKKINVTQAAPRRTKE